MSGITKKHIIVAVVLAILGIVTVLLLLKFMKGNPVNICIFQEENVEYTGDLYQMDDTTLKLKDGTELKLEVITYYPEQKELQFGFTLAESDSLKDKLPYTIELTDAVAGTSVSKEPFFISEVRDGQYCYRTVFREAAIDVEKSQDLLLTIKDEKGTELYSDIFISEKTLFTAKPFSAIDSRDIFKATLGSENDSSAGDSSSNAA